MGKLKDNIRKWIKTIPQSILGELWAIGQEHEYQDPEVREWNEEDEFWTCISNANREGNNPDDYPPTKICKRCEKLWNILEPFEGELCKACEAQVEYNREHYPIREDIRK